MKRNISIYMFTAAVIAAFIFAAGNAAVAQKPREERNTIVTTRRIAAPGVSKTNQLAFQTGKDFAIAIEDAKFMKDDDESFNFAIVDLVYLIDGLEGQSEAAQLQAILKGIVRGTKDLTKVSSEIAAISNAFLARQTAEQKWYFTVGTTQMNLIVAGWSKDSAATAKNLKELQALVKTAPQGTTKLVLEAINGLAKYATLNPFTVADYGDMIDDAKLITTLMYA